MLAEPRAIFYQTELRLAPIEELGIRKERVRDLYNKMFEPSGCRYENLDLQADIPTLSTRKEKGQSICQVGQFLIRIEENWPEGHVDHFIEVVRTVISNLGSSPLPPVIGQRCNISCITQPNSSNSIVLLGGKIARVLDAIDPFERPPTFFGIRFRFVPKEFYEDDEQESDEQTLEEPTDSGAVVQQHGPVEMERMNFVTLRFETYSKDIKQVWMEAVADYPNVIDSCILLLSLKSFPSSLSEWFPS
jgi:hypothetical protein